MENVTVTVNGEVHVTTAAMAKLMGMYQPMWNRFVTKMNLEPDAAIGKTKLWKLNRLEHLKELFVEYKKIAIPGRKKGSTGIPHKNSKKYKQLPLIKDGE